MIPIFEQGSGKGIGHSVASFTARFESLCHEHMESGRARAFAFIFYDFGDQTFRAILKDQGVFAKLDRLSGRDLSIFYLHTARRSVVERFNAAFLEKLGIASDIQLPCLVFFRVNGDQVTDIRVAQFEGSDLIHGFHELYGAIERYKNEDLGGAAGQSKYVQWFVSGVKFVSIEVFRAWLKVTLQGHIGTGPPGMA